MYTRSIEYDLRYNLCVVHLLLCLHAQLLAASLSSLLSGLDVHEDVFTVGELSSLVATQLGGLAETQARRKVSSIWLYCAMSV